MTKTYYVRRRGIVHGPFTKQQLQDGIKSKKLDPAADEYSTAQAGPWQAAYAIEYEAQESMHSPPSNALSTSAYVDHIRKNSAYRGARTTVDAFAKLSFLCVGIAASIGLVVTVGNGHPAWIAVFLLGALAVGAIQLSQAVFLAFFDGVDAIIDVGRKSPD